MEDVVREGTGSDCQLSNMHVAGKTGTTDTYNDLWFVGYTPYYTCAVWSGYDNNDRNYLIMRGTSYQGLWNNVMSRIHEDLQDKDFDKPATVEKQLSAKSLSGMR